MISSVRYGAGEGVVATPTPLSVNNTVVCEYDTFMYMYTLVQLHV